MHRILPSALVLSVAMFGSTNLVAADQLPVSQQSGIWRYSITSPADDWVKLDFDDNSWTTGVAPFGFGELGLKTITHAFREGEAVPVTTYFRTEFEASPGLPKGILRLKIRVDDGFAAFLNGAEVYRWNVPSGTLTSDTLATTPLSAPDEQLFQQFEFSPDSLRAGRNVMAIEVHQINNRSTDLYLDASWSWHSRTMANLAQAVGEAGVMSMAFNSTHRVSELTKIPDGFLDGGREMQIDEFGFTVSGREILRVDRTQDCALQKHLEYAGSAEIVSLNEVDRATHIARYIDRVMTPTEGRESCEPRSELLADRYASREVLIGDVCQLCGAGVCRHRALLFKLMADEAGLSCALVRGNYGNARHLSGHTWNELLLTEKKRVVVDVMNPQPDYYFPAVGEKSLRHYLTVAGTEKYAVGQ